MSSNIIKYSNNAQLALASYANFEGVTNEDVQAYIDALTDSGLGRPGMSVEQARAFIGLDENNVPIAGKGFEIIHHESNSATGFSATVFLDRETSRYHFAIRGTVITNINDLIADANAVLSGGAVEQVISMLNYYMRLITPEEESTVQVLSLGGGVFLPTTAEGLGILDPDTPLTVTGHSLGGHLASAFGKAFPIISNAVTEVYTYNGLGVGPGINSLLNQVADLYDITPDTTSDNSSFNVTNLIAEPGITLTPNAFAASNQLGEVIFTFIEEGILIQNHSSSRLADALAVYKLFAAVDPQLSLEDITYILQASTNNAGLTLETAVNSLQEVLNIGGGMVSPHNRDQLYRRIHAIHEAVSSESSLQGIQIQPLTDPATVLKLKAVGPQLDLGGDYDSADAIAYRYALVNLNPFVITGNASLYDAHNGDDRLELYDPATGTGMLTENYLEDRAAALTIMLAANMTNNANAQQRWDGNVSINYLQVDGQGDGEDLARKIGRGRRGGRTAATQEYVIFGSDSGDRLIAGNGSSRLYGGDGDDILRGSLGSPDRLEGGLGNNTYHVTPGDVIFDVNREATIRFRSATINNIAIGGSYTRQGENVYRHNSRPITIIIHNDGVATVKVGDTLNAPSFTIENFMDPSQGFVNGNYGITLNEMEEVPQSGNQLVGTINNNALIAELSSDGVYIDGVGGQNYLTGSNGNDEIHGGSGNDVIFGNAGDDRLFGGGGNNIIAGGLGNDYIVGGEGNNILNGNAGDDIIHGGGGTNVIGGGPGSDIIFGGAGNNFIHGGFGIDMSSSFWDVVNDVINTPNANYPDDWWGVEFIYSPDGYLHSFTFNNLVLIDDQGFAAGDNIIIGGGGDNILLGHIGNDIIIGGSGRNHINSGAGDNKIWGGPSNDLIIVGDGNNTVDAVGGDNRVYAGNGDDTLYGGSGNDLLVAEGGNNILHGVAGNNLLVGGTGDDFLYGGTGNDELQGTAGNNYLSAGGGNNRLFGGPGDDVLVSGPGNNELQGGLGNDSYHYHRGDGHDIIHDEGGFDKLYLHGITLEDLDFIQSENNLIISVSDDSSITLWNWQDSSPIDIILFDDGRVLFANDFLGESLPGKAYYVDDHTAIHADSDGNNYFFVDNNIVSINSGAGDDIYAISESVKHIIINDSGGQNTVFFEYNPDISNVSGEVKDGILYLQFDSVQFQISNWLKNPVDRFIMADGTELSHSDLDENINYELVESHTIVSPVVNMHEYFEFQIPDALFIDSGTGELFQADYYTISVVNHVFGGGMSPFNWLTYDGSQNLLHGTPGFLDIGLNTISITGVSGFRSATTQLTIDVQADSEGYAVFDPNYINGENGSWVSTSFNDGAYFRPIGDVTGNGINDLLMEGDEYYYVVYGRPGLFGEQVELPEITPDTGFRIEFADDNSRIVEASFTRSSIIGDINGDGIDDIFLHTRYVDATGISRSRGTIILGGGQYTDGVLTITDQPQDGVIHIYGDPQWATSNTSPFINIYDVNNDGNLDIQFHNYMIYGSAISSGEDIYIEHLTEEQGKPLDNNIVLQPLGDFNGDGINDYYTVADGHYYVIFGTESGMPDNIDLSQIDGSNGFRLINPPSFITAFASIGDFNNNGFSDIAIGMPGYDLSRGAVKIIWGTDEFIGPELDLSALLENSGSMILGAASSDSLGTSINIAGDVNGNGLNDLLIGSARYAYDYSELLVLYGSESQYEPIINLGMIDYQRGLLAITHGGTGNPTHISGASIGDINGNGYDDVYVIGQSGNYIIYGSDIRHPTYLAGTRDNDYLVMNGDISRIFAGSGNDTIIIEQVNARNNVPSPHYIDYVVIDTGLGDNIVVFGESGMEINPNDPENLTVIRVTGGPGDNSYYVNGDGAAIIIDDRGRGENGNSIYFGENYHYDDMEIHYRAWDPLVIRFGGGLSEVHLASFERERVLEGHRDIDYFHFSDGTILTYEELIAQGFNYGTSDSDDSILGTSIDDIIYGFGGDDILRGYAGNNHIYGVTGSNRLHGGSGNDHIYGGDGDDTIYGEGGNNRLYGGAGNDYIYGGNGNNYFDGGPGNDHLIGGTGNDTYYYERGYGSDTIQDSGGHDTLIFGPGISPENLILEVANNDLIIKLSNTDQIRIRNYFHINGNHIIEDFKFDGGVTLSSQELLSMNLEPTTLISDGSGGAIDVETWMEYVFVGDGDNEINISTSGRSRDLNVGMGSGNNTVRISGPGIASGSRPSVWIQGGTGDNEYFIDGNVGVVHIDDPASAAAGNSVSFGEGYHPQSVKLTLGSLVLTFGDGFNEVHLKNFDPDDVLGGPRTIETFRFADGTVLSYEELVSQGFDITGTSGNDVLRGTNLTDRIVALEGNNTFEGGQGDDYLEGGTGNNTYIYNPGDGHDVIFDHGGNNRIVFGDGIDADMLELERSDDDLVINIIGDGQITVQAWYDPSGNHQIASLGFADGQIINTLDLLEAPNNPPILNQPLSDVTVKFGKPFNLTLPENTFIDIDPGDELVLTATLADGSALPGWLTFNPESATFSGKAKLFDFGAHEITVSATDLAGDSVSDTFTLTVTHSGKGPGHPFFPGGWGKHKFWGGFGMKWGHPSFHGGWKQMPPGKGAAFGPGNPFVHGQVQSLVQAMATFSPGGYGGSHFSSNVVDDTSSMIAAALETA